MPRRLLVVAFTAAALTIAAPVAPASATFCGGLDGCLCRTLGIGCGPITGCYDTGELKFCL